MIKQYLETGEIVGTHGIRGEVRVNPWSDTPDFLCGFKTFYFDDKGKKSIKVKSSRVHGNVVLVKFEDCDTIETAEKMRGKILYINRKDANLPEGRSFVQDIIGCEVIDADTEQSYGKVTDVITGIANDVWTIVKDGKEYLLPAIDEVVIKKNLEDERIFIKPLKGIFDDED